MYVYVYCLFRGQRRGCARAITHSRTGKYTRHTKTDTNKQISNSYDMRLASHAFIRMIIIPTLRRRTQESWPSPRDTITRVRC